MTGIGELEAGWSLRITANNYLNDGLIMIDDIQLINCSVPEGHGCKADQLQCVSGACADQDQICDFGDDCGDRTDEQEDLCKSYPERCNFEDDYCHWSLDEGEAKWFRKRGDDVAQDLGPDYDHTYYNNTGYYMYLMSGKGDKEKIGKMHSVPFQRSSGECYLRFWFMMRSNESATLAVYAEDSPASSYLGLAPQKLFSESG